MTVLASVPSILPTYWKMHLRVLKQTPVPHIMIYLPMLPKNSDEIFVILKHIFNISLERGVFPDKLDKARETPIFKKGKKYSSNQL